MKYYIFLYNNKFNGCGQCKILNPEYQNIEVTEEVYNKFSQDPDYYIWDGNAVVENPNYEEVKYKQRADKFHEEFFKTSLGWVRRTVTMKNGTTKDFLTDLLNSIKVGLTIPLYEEPDFSQNVDSDVILRTQHLEKVTQQFKDECEAQLAVDFFGFNPIPTPETTEETLDNEDETEYNETVEEGEE